MTNENCTMYEDCEAPLCPAQPGSIEHGLWYTDEAICRARRFQRLPWIRKLKRIAKLGLAVDDGFFTMGMLEAIQAITKSLKGADPDDWDSEQKWLKQRKQERARGSQKRGGQQG